MGENITVKHSFNMGDLISLLPCLRHLYEQTGKKSIIYQRTGFYSHYYENNIHSTKNKDGEGVTMTDELLFKLKPLLESQDYIESLEVWQGQDIDYDMDKTRDRHSIPIPYGIIQHWAFGVFPEMAHCIDTKGWINESVEPICGWSINVEYFLDKIIINKTERYNNPYIDYKFLREYESELIFTGTLFEHELFCTENKLNIPLLEEDNFLHLAQIMASCKLFIGNQSFCYHLAESMAIPRVLELCAAFPNTFPLTKNGYGFYYQEHFKYFVNKLLND